MYGDGPVSRTNIDDYLEREVYPALYCRLDSAFSEFKFKRENGHWRSQANPGVCGLAAGSGNDRIYAYERTPDGTVSEGFVVQGTGTGSRWIEYLAGRSSVRGSDFKEALAQLCELAGVSAFDFQTSPELSESNAVLVTDSVERVLEVLWELLSGVCRRHSIRFTGVA